MANAGALYPRENDHHHYSWQSRTCKWSIESDFGQTEALLWWCLGVGSWHPLIRVLFVVAGPAGINRDTYVVLKIQLIMFFFSFLKQSMHLFFAKLERMPWVMSFTTRPRDEGQLQSITNLASLVAGMFNRKCLLWFVSCFGRRRAEYYSSRGYQF